MAGTSKVTTIVKEISVLKYCLIGILSFLVFLVCLFPARVAFNAIQSAGLVLPPSISVQGINGSIWNGAADLSIGGLKHSKLEWELLLSRLFLGGIGVDVNASNEGFKLDGSVSIYLPLPDDAFFPVNAELELDGFVSGNVVSALAPQFNVWFDGQAELDNVLVVLTDTGVDDVAGRVTWGGGKASANAMGRKMTVDLPAMAGDLFKESEDAKFELIRSEDKQSLVEAGVESSGWAHVRVRQRMFEYFVPFGKGKDKNSFAFEYEQKIF